MYVRFNVDSNGRINLQQLLKLMNDKEEIIESWENVPLKGLGAIEKIDAPLAMNSGIFLIEEDKSIHAVSAFSISKISEYNINKTRIDTFEKGKFFIIKMPYLEFVTLMVKMLNRFMTVSISSDGNITFN